MRECSSRWESYEKRERNGGIGCVCEREIELKFCLSNTNRLDVKNFEMRIGKVSWLEREREIFCRGFYLVESARQKGLKWDIGKSQQGGKH